MSNEARPFREQAERIVPIAQHVCNWSIHCTLEECICGAISRRAAEVERTEQAIADAVEATWQCTGFDAAPIAVKLAIAKRMSELAERRKGGGQQ